jgi:hypothetical protein
LTGSPCEATGQHGLAGSSGEDRTGEGGDEKHADGEGDEDHDDVDAVEELILEAQAGGQRLQKAAEEAFEDEDEGVGTMKKGMKRGPSRAQTAEAIMPKETTKRTAGIGMTVLSQAFNAVLIQAYHVVPSQAN